MAKKNKRQTRKETVVSNTPVVVSSDTGKTADFNPDYSYVITDLRRIGILAGTFITILVVLAFFLR